ncbi:MAG: PilW family protein [Gammaproteobacteria bacterium]|nr:PilW family protein [Gammaproteobacteria bacterium]
MMKQFKHQSGFSLIEMMVGLVLSLFLIGGVIQVYIANKDKYRFVEAAARVQENLRFAVETITRDARQARFYGCINNPGKVEIHLDPAGAGYNPVIHAFQHGVIGEDATGLNGADGITLQGAFQHRLPLLSVVSPGVLMTSPDHGIMAGSFFAISNCNAFAKKSREIFQATAGDQASGQIDFGIGAGMPGNKTNTPIANAYNNKGDASVYPLSTITYSIALSTQTNEPSLFRQADELAAGIENMQILYGIYRDTGVYEYKTATELLAASALANPAEEFNNVVSIKLSILAVSQMQNVLEEPQKYEFNGAQLTAPDRRLRHVIETVIAVRNRLSTN